MAESVDALLSNTSAATHLGSSPSPGTELRILTARVLFSFTLSSQLIGFLIDKLRKFVVGIGSMFVYVKYYD